MEQDGTPPADPERRLEIIVGSGSDVPPGYVPAFPGEEAVRAFLGDSPRKPLTDPEIDDITERTVVHVGKVMGWPGPGGKPAMPFTDEEAALLKAARDNGLPPSWRNHARDKVLELRSDRVAREESDGKDDPGEGEVVDSDKEK